MIITLLSDSPFLPTGYSNQAKQLAKFLTKQGHQIHFLANAYNGATIENAKLEDGTEFNYKIYGEVMQSYFANTMSQHLKQTNTDRFIILLDTFMLYGNNGWFLNIDTSPAKTYFWFPSDGGGGMPKNCENILKKIDYPVAMAKFGQKQVKDYYDLDVLHIPHGIDSKKLYRLPDNERDELRKKWNLEDKFVIGVVARNQPRKHLDRTIKMMYLLKDRIPNAVLFLHLDPNDPAQPMFNMSELIKKYGLENRVRFSGMNCFKGFPEKEMINVYNLMDCFFLSTSGEGFGIPTIEAMSCKVPALVTDYTTTQELVKDNNAGFGIRLSGVENLDMFSLNSIEYDKLCLDGTMTGSWEVERGFCSIKDAVDKICYIYEHPEEAKKMGENGRKAVIEKYDFETKVGPMWEKLIK